MGDFSLDDFPVFFEAVTGNEPFLWQVELTDRLLAGRIPDVIDVPTGFGKTSVVHCWAFALAATAPALGVPRRLCFVVDRRLVVDATWDDARDLAAALEGAMSEGDGVSGAVADGLALMHPGSGLPPLQVVGMRGGVTWESRWLARPDAPAIIVGTVDQFGSRLLFRGYGASDGMRPIDAALVGTDCWLVVDEAHISEPLVQTSSSVARHQAASTTAPWVLPLQVTTMSATTNLTGDVLRSDPDREANSDAFPRAAEAARARLAAQKPAVLVDIENLDSVSPSRRREGFRKLGGVLADLAQSVDEDARVVGVIANTIATARAAHGRLVDAGAEAILMIGRCRAFERERLLDGWLPRIAVGAERDPSAQRLFVVATQTIEVGANIDLDALVTECAPLSSLIQRFGRVNRLGARPMRVSAIIHAGFAHGEDDPVYGTSTAATWTHLADAREPVGMTTKQAHLPSDGGGSEQIDMGLSSARRLADEGQRLNRSVGPSPPFTPRLLGAHLERWAATYPRPFPDQPVDVFLHGLARAVPEVEVAWRAAPPDGLHDPAAWRWWLDVVRPVSWEFVRVPVWEVAALLRGELSDLPTPDIEEIDSAELEAEYGAPPEERVFGVVYGGPQEEPRLIQGPADVTAGTRIVLDAMVGGHDAWGWVGATSQDNLVVPDVADLAPTRARSVLRLHPAPLATLVPDDQRAAIEEALAPLLELLDDESGATRGQLDRDVLIAAVEGVAGALPGPAADRLREAVEWTAIPTIDEREARRLVLLVDRGTPGAENAAASDAISDSDELSTSSGARRQTLRVHGEEVARLAREFARNLGLPEQLQRAVEMAGLWHDAGKADFRFQVSLHDGDELEAKMASESLAKSGRDYRDPVRRRARKLSGLPSGFRHEAISGRLVRALATEHPEALAGLDVDLVHHLVVSHHGQARPLVRAIIDSDAPQVAVDLGGHRVKVEGADQVDWDHPVRFESLNARYGWWGVALLEALVRLADIRCSEAVGS